MPFPNRAKCTIFSLVFDDPTYKSFDINDLTLSPGGVAPRRFGLYDAIARRSFSKWVF